MSECNADIRDMPNPGRRIPHFRTDSRDNHHPRALRTEDGQCRFSCRPGDNNSDTVCRA